MSQRHCSALSYHGKGGRSDFSIPPVLVPLRLAVQKAAIPLAAKALEETYGIPSFASEMLLNAYVDEEAKLLKRVGINLPHDYDLPNGLLQLTIEARRDSQGTRTKVQRATDNKISKS